MIAKWIIGCTLGLTMLAPPTRLAVVVQDGGIPVGRSSPVRLENRTPEQSLGVAKSSAEVDYVLTCKTLYSLMNEVRPESEVRMLRGAYRATRAFVREGGRLIEEDQALKEWDGNKGKEVPGAAVFQDNTTASLKPTGGSFVNFNHEKLLREMGLQSKGDGSWIIPTSWEGGRQR